MDFYKLKTIDSFLSVDQLLWLKYELNKDAKFNDNPELDFLITVTSYLANFHRIRPHAILCCNTLAIFVVL